MDKDSLHTQTGTDAVPPIVEHVEEVHENGKAVPRKGIFLLPNLITTGALFSGFYAIIAAVNGAFENAAIAIFVAMILDGLDGRVARMTNTQSAFGAEYDSLSDMGSFGFAPALVVFSWSLFNLGKLGWMAAFIYVACAALRLAKFNTQVETADKNYFSGLPSPAAAAIMAGMVWLAVDLDLIGDNLSTITSIVAALVTIVVAGLMVVNVPYHSFKGLDFKGRVPFITLLAVVLVFVIVFLDPPSVLLTVFSVYALSGPILMIRRKSAAAR